MNEMMVDRQRIDGLQMEEDNTEMDQQMLHTQISRLKVA